MAEHTKTDHCLLPEAWLVTRARILGGSNYSMFDSQPIARSRTTCSVFKAKYRFVYLYDDSGRNISHGLIKGFPLFNCRGNLRHVPWPRQTECLIYRLDASE